MEDTFLYYGGIFLLDELTALWHTERWYTGFYTIAPYINFSATEARLSLPFHVLTAPHWPFQVRLGEKVKAVENDQSVSRTFSMKSWYKKINTDSSVPDPSLFKCQWFTFFIEQWLSIVNICLFRMTSIEELRTVLWKGGRARETPWSLLEALLWLSYVTRRMFRYCSDG